MENVLSRTNAFNARREDVPEYLVFRTNVESSDEYLLCARLYRRIGTLAGIPVVTRDDAYDVNGVLVKRLSAVFVHQEHSDRMDAVIQALTDRTASDCKCDPVHVLFSKNILPLGVPDLWIREAVRSLA